ncbi:MAG: FHA domain-containing protein [Tepidisphaeraceae bacterium]
MPYIVIKSNGQEIDRRELKGGIVIGRAPDCDVTLRDILLSRRHCRLEPDGPSWTLHDLQSKNGTILNGERLNGPWVLHDNDVVRLGRSKIIFHAGMPDEDIADQILTPARPADPGDSLAGTLSGFTLLLPGEGENPENMPCPQPRPKDPPAYGQEELQTLLSAIASSSWDSVYAEARQPMRGEENAVCEEAVVARRVRPRSPMDLSLQANPAAGAPTEVEPALDETEPPAKVAVILPKPPRKPGFRPSLHMVVAALWIVALVILNIDRKPVPRRAMGNQPAPISVSLPKMTPMADQSMATGAVDYQIAGDDELPAPSETARVAQSATAKQGPATKEMPMNSATAKLAAESGAPYLPLIVW